MATYRKRSGGWRAVESSHFCSSTFKLQIEGPLWVVNGSSPQFYQCPLCAVRRLSFSIPGRPLRSHLRRLQR